MSTTISFHRGPKVPVLPTRKYGLQQHLDGRLQSWKQVLYFSDQQHFMETTLQSINRVNTNRYGIMGFNTLTAGCARINTSPGTDTDTRTLKKIHHSSSRCRYRHENPSKEEAAVYTNILADPEKFVQDSKLETNSLAVYDNDASKEYFEDVKKIYARGKPGENVFDDRENKV